MDFYWKHHNESSEEPLGNDRIRKPGEDEALFNRFVEIEEKYKEEILEERRDWEESHKPPPLCVDDNQFVYNEMQRMKVKRAAELARDAFQKKSNPKSNHKSKNAALSATGTKTENKKKMKATQKSKLQTQKAAISTNGVVRKNSTPKSKLKSKDAALLVNKTKTESKKRMTATSKSKLLTQKEAISTNGVVQNTSTPKSKLKSKDAASLVNKTKTKIQKNKPIQISKLSTKKIAAQTTGTSKKKTPKAKLPVQKTVTPTKTKTEQKKKMAQKPKLGDKRAAPPTSGVAKKRNKKTQDV